jgi:signal transduction histidine kinase
MPTSKQATILYIEDDAASRALVERVLTHAGYRVLVAARALEGIDLAQRRVPDLVLIDINLPDLSGREIATRLRADSRLASVPIVALTALSQNSDRELAFAAGVTGYLTKPLAIDTLPARLAEYLQGRRDAVDAAAVRDAGRAYHQELVSRLEATIRELEASNETLRRLDQIKEDFIQLTAHELRTPLTTVYGYSRLVQTSEAIRRVMTNDPEAEACLTGLIDSIERLRSVVSEIITVSRVASGRVDLKLGIINFVDMMKKVIEGYVPILEQRRLQVDYHTEKWPAVFYADGALLELAFSNILSNAIKYTPDGGMITIDAAARDAQTVRISVRDTGIGIDREEQERIFDRFYTAGDTQLHSSSKTAFRGGGLGLGLAISRGVVEAHGGRIWVESEGCDEARLPGSAFFIELPLDAHEREPTRHTIL